MEENKGIHRSAFYPIMFAVMLVIGIWLGTYINPSVESSHEEEQLNKISSILDIIENKYVDEVDRDKLVEKAIAKMLEDLDPHSSYIPARDIASVQEQLEGRFQGVGIRFLILRDTLMVTHVIPGGPAERAGVQPFDRLIEIDGENITNIDLTNKDVQDRLKGEAGSHVDVIAYDGTNKKDLRIIRNYVPISSIETAYMIDDETGFIKLNTFSENCYIEFISAAEVLLQKGMKKLVFDLRYNTGGFLGQAAQIVDEFLPGGKLIVYTEGKSSPKDMTYTSDRGKLKNIDVVVLINSGSASASEIVAGALQDNDRAIIMGRRSFGKGLVQNQTPLKDGSALRLTIARYYTPTGRSIQKPYGDNVDYDQDIYERYENEEYLHIDSSLFVDSLKYVTEGGRVVYGGGGIMPDIFVPLDTSGGTFFLDRLLRLQAFYKFGFDYVSKHGKSFFNALSSYKDNFKIKAPLIKEFIDYAKGLGSIDYTENELKISEERVHQNLKAEIARFVWDSRGYYTIVNQFDNDVVEAVTVLKLPERQRLEYRILQ